MILVSKEELLQFVQLALRHLSFWIIRALRVLALMEVINVITLTHPRLINQLQFLCLVSDMADEQPDTSWLDEVLEEAKEKRESEPAMVPPPVSSIENAYVNISEEEKERKFRRGNLILIFLVVIQLIALGFVIWWP